MRAGTSRRVGNCRRGLAVVHALGVRKGCRMLNGGAAAKCGPTESFAFSGVGEEKEEEG